MGGRARAGRQPGHQRPGARGHRPELLGAVGAGRRRVPAGEAARGRRRVGAVGIDPPAASDLEIVVEGAAAGRRDGGSEHRVGATGLLHEVEDRLAVAPGLRGDPRVVGVVLDRQLEGVGEDPVAPVLVVVGRPRGDVQVARLLGPVAVRGGHVPSEPGHRRMVLDGHVAGDVGLACSRTDHITRRPYSWKEIAVRICCRPFTTRPARKSRNARSSGLEKARGPR